MRHFKSLCFTALLLGASSLLTSCGNDDSGDLVDLTVTSNSIILRTDAQSCVDKSTTVAGTVTRSLTKPVLSISGVSLTWKSDALDMYVGLIEVTVSSPYLTGGKAVVDLDSTEIEALLGAKGAIVKREAVSGTPRVYISTNTSTLKDSSSAGLALAPCGLSVGGLTLVDPLNTNSFIAQVKIQLIGTASSSDGSTQKTVLKTIYTTATYY